MIKIKLTIFLLLVLSLNGTVLRKTYIDVAGKKGGWESAGAYDSVGACWYNSTDPLHGGPGYSDIIDYTTLSNNHSTSFIVTGAGTPEDSLVLFLNQAGVAGDTVYVMDTLELDLSGQTEDLIACLLCSGRGRVVFGDTVSWGALLYVQKFTNYDDIFVTFSAGARITGLRMRGSYSTLEGLMVPTDSFTLPAYNGGDAVRVNHDDFEMDNCELWGFAYAPFRLRYESDSVKIHHNYLHHGNHVYHGYGMACLDSSSFYFESNYTDYFGWIVMGGGGNNGRKVDGFIRYNYIGEHAHGAAIFEHADAVDSSATHQIYGNTIMRRGGFSHNLTTGYSSDYTPRDSTLIYKNWFWEEDSVHTFKYNANALIRISDNEFGTSLPEGNSTKIPTAAIWSNTDSGAVPLVCSLSALNSTDPDGSIAVAYWQLGDSAGTDNWLRTATFADTFVHTFTEIGNYYVELRVHDDEGIPDLAYKTIKVTPVSDNDHYLSCWVKDRCYSNESGELSKEIWLDGWKIYDSDVAGNGTWEHVVIDVTDTLNIKDSITVYFKFKCDANSSIWEPRMYVDDVVMYGANVLNGNFESGTWSGTSERSDGTWLFSGANGADWYMDTNSGLRAIEMNGISSQNDSAMYYQRVDVY